MSHRDSDSSTTSTSDSQQIECCGCTHLITVPKDGWKGKCENEACACVNKTAFVPVSSGWKYIRYIPHSSRKYARVPEETLVFQKDQMCYIIDAKNYFYQSGQKVYKTEKATYEVLLSREKKIESMRERRNCDDDEKEVLRKQLRMMTEEKDACLQRVSVLAEQLEDSATISTFWKQMANINETNLAGKEEELKNSIEQFSAFRLESEEKTRELQEAAKKIQADADEKMLETSKQAMDQNQKEVFSQKTKAYKTELALKSQLEAENRTTIQELKNDNKWLRNVVASQLALLDKLSSKGSPDKEIKESNFCDKDKVAKNVDPFNDRCQEDGMEGEEDKENGLNVEGAESQMNDEDSDCNEGDASSSSA